MKPITLVTIVAILVSILTACVTAAPGADQVKITRNASDVAACKPVGNISAASMNNLDPVVAQNNAVGLGANVVFNSGNGGIAYKCN
jgi:hypothetical protein